ncbi:Phospholipase A-2-activating protein [Mycena kentingensis (nom. inval.)]|nr:Phospholipase A-2-activating protein [Mycena kentingensis (nom. inval.)]
MMPYKLSATLAGHTLDARSLAAPADDLILSASRDSTAIVWRPQSAGFAQDSVFHPSTRAVNAVAYLPPTPEAPKGAEAASPTGLSTVYSLDPAKDDPKYTLLGHSANICGLRTTPGGQIVSCWWDATARVWKDFAQLYELKGHENSVWDALAVSEDEFITGSADKTIKVWKQNKPTSPTSDSRLVPTTKSRFGRRAATHLLPPRPHVLHLPARGTTGGDLVSSSEDRSVRVWKDGECAQVLVHPAISVWAVATLPNGDIVSGASDKNIRIFSSTPERWASDGDLRAYDDVQESAKHYSCPKGDATQVYQWDGSSGSFSANAPKTPANTGAKSKVHYEGKEYDYVWSVAIEDGEPALKLPYNVSENPAAAAANFLERNGLPLSHVNTVVEFIYQNTAGETLGGGGGEDYGDPFTGMVFIGCLFKLTFCQARPDTVARRPNHRQTQTRRRTPIHTRARHGTKAPPLPTRLRHPTRTTPTLSPARVAVLWRSSIRRVAGVKEKLFAAPFKAAEWRADNFPSPNKVQEMNAMLASRAADGAGDGYGGWLSRILGVIRTVGYEKLSAAQKKPRATMLLNVSCLSLFTSFVPALRHTYVAPIANVPDTEGAGGDAESVYRALVGLGNVVSAFSLAHWLTAPARSSTAPSRSSTAPSHRPISILSSSVALTLSATRPNMRRELLPPEPRLGAPWSGAPSKPSRRASHAQPGCGLVHPSAASTPTPVPLHPFYHLRTL